MQKIDTLRAALTAALPELAAHPARLRLWVENGTAQARHTATHAFAYSFRLKVLVMDLATDISVLSLAIFIWLRTNQPELLAPGTNGFSFDVDILDNETVDVLIELALTQNVTVARNPDGSFALQDLPEPVPLFGDDHILGGGETIPLLSRVSLTDGTILLPENASE